MCWWNLSRFFSPGILKFFKENYPSEILKKSFSTNIHSLIWSPAGPSLTLTSTRRGSPLFVWGFLCEFSSWFVPFGCQKTNLASIYPVNAFFIFKLCWRHLSWWFSPRILKFFKKKLSKWKSKKFILSDMLRPNT